MFNYGFLLSSTICKKNLSFLRYYYKYVPLISSSDLLGPTKVQLTPRTYDHLLRLCFEQCGNINERQLFDEMPHRISFAFVTCKVIHCCSLKFGFELNRQLGNAILDLYAKCGNVGYAKTVFERLEVRDVQNWNSIMSMYMRIEFYDVVLKLFGQMRSSGVLPNAFTYAIVLSSCAKMMQVDIGKQVHCDIIKMGYVYYLFGESSLPGMYVKGNALGDARQIFDQLHNPSLVSWTAMITSYVQKGLHDEALQVFEKMRTLGFVPDHVVCTTVISALVNEGNLNKARDLFRQMPLPNSIAWNVMISGHEKRGCETEAIWLYRYMRKACVTSTRSTLGSVLRAIASLKALDVGLQVHALAIKEGLDDNVYVGSSLLNMYAKCEKLESARQVFDSLDERNIVLWNAMLGGYIQNGFASQVVGLFMDMKEGELRADEYTYTSILSACGSLQRVDFGSQLHSLIIKTNFESNLFVGNAMVDMYAKSGCLAEARQLFERIEDKDNVSWNAIIAGHVQVEEEREAFSLFQEMRSHGMKADEFSMASILSACANLKDLVGGRQIHSLLVKHGLATRLYPGSALIDLYVKCGVIQTAHEVFSRLQHWSVVSVNSLIGGLAQDSLEEAVQIYKLMLAEGLCPSDITFASLLDGCHGSYGFNLGIQIHSLLLKKGILYDEGFLGISLLSMYMDYHMNADATKLFFEFPGRKSAVLWTTMISGLNQNEFSEEALQLYREMRSYDVLPDQATFASILKVCSTLTSLKDGAEIHSFVIRSGFHSDVPVSCALVDMYSKCGDVRSSIQMFNDINNKMDVILWNSIIVGLAKNGYVEDVLKIFGEMMQLHVCPDEVTFLGVLSACSHGGKVCEGRHFYDMMVNQYGIQPRNDHCACIIDLLGRWGLLEEAEDFIKRLEFEPDAKIWASFLGACKLHGDEVRGRKAAEHLIQLDPHNSSGYTLLSSIHASSGNWSEVDSLRKEMKKKGVFKFPGSSWIDRTEDTTYNNML